MGKPSNTEWFDNYARDVGPIGQVQSFLATSHDDDGSLLPAAVTNALGGSLPVNARDYGFLPTASAADNTTALNDALTAAAANVAASGLGAYGGVVIMPAGAYDFDGLVSVPSLVDLIGMGTYATRLNATAADAQIRFGDGGGATTATNIGGVSGRFRIWGASLATNPLFVGLSVARTFENIDVNHALGDGLRLEQTQNCIFVEVNVTLCGATGSGVVLDYGAGGNKFEKCEFSVNGYANGRSTHSGAVTGTGYVVVQHNSFDHCIFEGPGQSQSQVATFVHEAGTSMTFKDCVFSQFSGATGQAELWGTSIPVFQMTKLSAASVSSRVSFIGGCLLNGSAPTVGTSYKGIGIDCSNSAGQSGANIYCGPGTVIQICDVALKIGDSSTIEVDNLVLNAVTTRFANQSAGVATEAMVVRHRRGHTDLTGVDPAYPTLKTTAATSQTANLVEHYGTSGLVANLTNSGSWILTGGITTSLMKSSSRGAVGTPAFTFSNDPDCGMWSPTTNQVAFSTNGIQRLLFDQLGTTIATGGLERGKVAPTYSSSITPDASAGDWHAITATNTTAFTVNAPSNPPNSSHTQDLTIEIVNSSGGAMGAITWDAAFVFAGATWANPASTKKRSAHFRWSGTAWVCVGVSAADY